MEQLYKATEEELQKYKQELEKNIEDVNKIINPLMDIKTEANNKINTINFLIDLHELPFGFIFNDIYVTCFNISETYTPGGGSGAFGNDWDPETSVYIYVKIENIEYIINYSKTEGPYNRIYVGRNSNVDENIIKKYEKLTNMLVTNDIDIKDIWSMCNCDDQITRIFLFNMLCIYAHRNYYDSTKKKDALKKIYGKYYQYEKSIRRE